MSVLLETSSGDIVIDLLVDYAPKLCENFLKLCKVKYYNFSPIHSVQKNFSFQTGDPLGPLSKESDGGTSIWGHLSGDGSKKMFPAFFHPKLKHLERGTVSMATAPLDSDPDTRVAASQFIVTLGDETDYLDGKAAVFGKVVEGFDVLEKINEAIVDDKGHPLIDIRIKHTIILDDPYPDPPELREPSASPPPTKSQLDTVRIADEAALHEDDDLDEEAIEKRRRDREARAQALTLEMMGDLPFAEVAPPENVLFVCKLNPVTTDADLELIFGRFGKILSCEVIRDAKTGDSLQYAFIEYADKASCEAAYSKMQDVLIDDRRIHVDFSQSVSKLSQVWRDDTNQKRRKHASRGGWGGVDELEKRRQYRDEYERNGDNYDLVIAALSQSGYQSRTEIGGTKIALEKNGNVGEAEVQAVQEPGIGTGTGTGTKKGIEIVIDRTPGVPDDGTITKTDDGTMMTLVAETAEIGTVGTEAGIEARRDEDSSSISIGNNIGANHASHHSSLFVHGNKRQYTHPPVVSSQFAARSSQQQQQQQ
ncbi:RNA recognition domain-containing protein [Colletotrichum higginsianum]|uniref:Peptidyl-prolyl cis-trans isomerase n=1 Tax=Colletotrichum higginsianum (strain IMI 349063) TaxID=759273 RepID=H1V2U5_COLHI|nr:RNA recognition domain-containing protein [Colletotrichum higginsianum IMI 349063]OBR07039.1 RNA recognition domain-containing protein [Colletotrichum higginsianum IMI 349063]CCF34547.1 RNA recognition domain-containing protein [Colletotrichum higginsianum]